MQQASGLNFSGPDVSFVPSGWTIVAGGIGMQWLARTQALIGEQALSVLQSSKVAVVGLGGVGGAAAEALCRAGVGTLVLVDHDTVDVTNLNRQLFATRPYVGISKCQARRRPASFHRGGLPADPPRPVLRAGGSGGFYWTIRRILLWTLLTRYPANWI